MSLQAIVEAGGQRVLRCINPATLEPVGEVPVATPEDVAAAVARARAAQPGWARTPVADRCSVLRRAKTLFVERMDEVAALIHAETGKPRREALYVDLAPTLDAGDLYTTIAPELLGEHRVQTRNHWRFTDSRIAHEPYGVVAVISPWNYPLSIPMGEIFPILIAGNACVIKPSEHTPLTMILARKILLDAGLPPELFQVVPGDGKTGAALVQARIDRLIFTGSVATGKKVAAQCAERMIPVTLELGGSDPALVLEDADLELASDGVVWGRFVNCGQTCCAVKRCFVHEKIAAAFLARVVEKVSRLKVGIDRAHDVDMGPMISEAQRGALEGQLADAVARGAKIVAGGARPALPGFFFQPTVVTGAPPDSKVLTEETFGPLLPVVVVGSDDEAVARANDSSFGLLASVWTRDLAKAREIATRIEAGTVSVNNCLWTYGVTETPWGGVKDSGLGRTHGPEGLLEMCRPKHVNVDKWLPAKKPWWYPLGTGEKGYQHTHHALTGLYGGGLGKLLRGAVGIVREKMGRS